MTLSPRVRILTTAVVYFAYFAFGFVDSIVSAARFDIADRTKSEFSQVTWGFTARNATYCIAALLCSFAFNRVNRQLLFIVSLFLSGAAILVTPFFTQLYLYIMSEGAYGFFIAVVDVASNALVLEMWEATPNPLMQGLYFCYSVGMTLAPLMVEPFLSNVPLEDEDDANNTTYHPLNGTNDFVEKKSQIEIPYAIGSGFLLFSGLALLVLHLRIPYQDPKRCVNQVFDEEGDDENHNNEVHVIDVNQTTSLVDVVSDRRYTYIVVIMGSLILCFYSGIEITTTNFFPTFVVALDLNVSKKKGAFMSSVLNGAYAVCRGISIVVAMKLNPRTMLYSCIGLLSIGNLLLLFFANTSEPMLWFCIIVLGVGHACVLPTIYSLFEERINVSNAVCGLFMLSACVNIVITPSILAVFMDETPLVLVYMNLVGLVICVFLFAGLHFADCMREKGKL